MSAADEAWVAYLDGDADDGYHDAEKPAFMFAYRRALEDAAHQLAEAFSGLDYTENAQEAAGEGEWSWFKWLALTTLNPDWPNTDDRAAAVAPRETKD